MGFKKHAKRMRSHRELWNKREHNALGKTELTVDKWIMIITYATIEHLLYARQRARYFAALSHLITTVRNRQCYYTRFIVKEAEY